MSNFGIKIVTIYNLKILTLTHKMRIKSNLNQPQLIRKRITFVTCVFLTFGYSDGLLVTIFDFKTIYTTIIIKRTNEIKDRF